MTETLKALIQVRELLADPTKWCHVYTDNGEGAHCLLGALARVNNGDWEPGRRAIMEANGIDSIANFNDAATHAQVLAAVDQAIRAERAGLPPTTDISIFTAMLAKAPERVS